MDWRSSTFFLFEEQTYVDGNFVVTQDQMLRNFEGFLDAWAAQGLNAVTLTWFMPVDPLSGLIEDAYAPDADPWLRGFPDAAKLTAFTEAAQARGMKVIWKPHFVKNEALSANVNDYFSPNVDVATFLSEVDAYWAGIAPLAQSLDVDMVILGTEHGAYAGATWDSEWRQIIATVRAAYSGTVTYDALGYVGRNLPGVDQVRFWDALDLIGISMYLPLGIDDTPSVAEAYDLIAANPVVDWQPTPTVDLVAHLQDLSQTWGKDIFFTEIGTNSSEGALVLPTGWSGQTSFFEQAVLYGVHLDTWTDTDFVVGMSWWNNTAELASPPGSDGWDNWFNGSITQFPFLGKSSGDILRAFWGHDMAGVPIEGDIVLGDTGGDHLIGGPLGEAIAGAQGNDTIEGQGGADRIIGGAGLDLILGGEGDDLLDGQGSGPYDGADSIYGGSGSDRIFGGPGGDLLVGDGADTLALLGAAMAAPDGFDL